MGQLRLLVGILYRMQDGGGRAYGLALSRGLGWAFPGERGRKATECFRVLTGKFGGHVSKYPP